CAIHVSTLGASPAGRGQVDITASCNYGATTKEFVGVNCGPLAIGRLRRVKDLLWAWSTAQHPIIATRTNRQRHLAEESTEISALISKLVELYSRFALDNCWNRNIKPKLPKVDLGWANFLVMRRTHSTLM